MFWDWRLILAALTVSPALGSFVFESNSYPLAQKFFGSIWLPIGESFVFLDVESDTYYGNGCCRHHRRGKDMQINPFKVPKKESHSKTPYRYNSLVARF
jgi:hypothetical protein